MGLAFVVLANIKFTGLIYGLVFLMMAGIWVMLRHKDLIKKRVLHFSSVVLIGVVIIGVQKHKINMLSIFLPANTPFGLGLLLVPIELISYIFKPISLGVRLFANLMAGHTLLKVIVGFAWSMLLLEDFISILHLIPLLVLVILMGLELGVAMIQAYVFTVLTCIYLNDSINLSH